MTTHSSRNPKTRRLITNFLILSFLVIGTAVAIKFAKGYRPDIQNYSLSGTGLLNITSYPKSARVIINDKLTTVTDDKLYLLPGNYTVKIEKDGFHPWTKQLPVKTELVTNGDARLFPIIPATSPLTFYQVRNTAINPDGTKIAYVLKNSPQETSNGLYIHALSNSLLGSSNIQLTENTSKDFSDSLLVWSPDSSQILAVFTEKSVLKSKPVEKVISAYLISTKGMNPKNMTDVSLRLPLIISQWQDQYAKLNLQTLSLYPDYMAKLLSENAANVFFSPDKEKVFYTPISDITLPENKIGETLPNINSTPESRNLVKNKTYLFDLKEGTNYLLDFAQNQPDFTQTLITVTDSTPSANINQIKQLKSQSETQVVTNINWYTNSKQLIFTNSLGVSISDYDGVNITNITNVTPLHNFVVSTPEGSKLILLTNINQKIDTFNLISFDLK